MLVELADWIDEFEQVRRSSPPCRHPDGRVDARLEQDVWQYHQDLRRRYPRAVIEVDEQHLADMRRRGEAIGAAGPVTTGAISNKSPVREREFGGPLAPTEPRGEPVQLHELIGDVFWAIDPVTRMPFRIVI